MKCKILPKLRSRSSLHLLCLYNDQFTRLSVSSKRHKNRFSKDKIVIYPCLFNPYWILLLHWNIRHVQRMARITILTQQSHFGIRSDLTLNYNPEAMLAIRACSCRLYCSGVLVAVTGFYDCTWFVLMKEIRWAEVSISLSCFKAFVCAEVQLDSGFFAVSLYQPVKVSLCALYVTEYTAYGNVRVWLRL